jgi:hypothetical protein
MSKRLEKLLKLAAAKAKNRADRASAEARFWAGLKDGKANRIATGSGKLSGRRGVDRATREETS